MRSYPSVNLLSRRRKLLTGAAVAGIGVFTGLLMWWRPERLRAPLPVAVLACAVFVWAGTAVALHAVVSARVYRWMMVVLLAGMTAVPAWIAFGPGARACRTGLGLPLGEAGCRTAFGIGTALLALMLLVALAQALRSTSSNMSNDDTPPR